MKLACRIILLSFGMTFHALSQNGEYTISGKILNGETGKSIERATIQVNNSLKQTFSDSLGYFQIQLQKNDVVSFNKRGFESEFMQLNFEHDSVLTVILNVRIQEIQEINVFANKLDTLISTRKASVQDYEFWGDQLVLLTYTRTLSDAKITLLTSNRDTLCSLKSPEKASRLFKDCFGFIHLITKDEVYELDFSKDSIFIYPGIRLDLFEETVFPCVGSTEKKLIFSEKYGKQKIETGNFKFESHNNLVYYYFIDKKDKSFQKIALIYDEETIKLKREELDYIMSKKSNRFYRENSFEAEFDLFFAEKILYKEIVAPLFTFHDSLTLFNFINHKIDFFDHKGEAFSSTGISFHLDEHWKRDVKNDPVSNRYFAVFEDRAIISLKEIDLKSGKITKTTVIPFAYPENIKVYENHLYFLLQSPDQDFPFCSLIKMRI